jgi:ketosteroid isomerase-like protein
MSAEDVARSYFDAHARRDPDGLKAHYSPDVVIDITGQGIFRGPDECRDYFAAVYAAVPDAEMIVDQVVADENVAAIQWRMRGTFKGGTLPPGIEPTGAWVELRGSDFVEVGPDGKITRGMAYLDGMELARTLGMMPPSGSGGERAMLAAFNLATKARQTVRERFG